MRQRDESVSVDAGRHHHWKASRAPSSRPTPAIPMHECGLLTHMVGHKSRHRRTGVVATLAADGSYRGYRKLRRRVLARFVPGRRLARCILHSKHEHLGHATWSLYLRHAHDPMAVGQQVAAPWCPRGDHGARAKTCPRPLCVVETRHDLRPGGPIRFQREVILIDGNGSKDNVDVGRR